MKYILPIVLAAFIFVLGDMYAASYIRCSAIVDTNPHYVDVWCGAPLTITTMILPI